MQMRFNLRPHLLPASDDQTIHLSLGADLKQPLRNPFQVTHHAIPHMALHVSSFISVIAITADIARNLIGDLFALSDFIHEEIEYACLLAVDYLLAVSTASAIGFR